MTFTADPSGFQVGGTTLTRGGAAATISGTMVSLGSSELLVGSSAVQLPPETNVGILTVPEGQVFTPNVNGFVIGSTTLYQGGPAVTVSGTVASFGPSGLVVGSNTISVAFTPSVFVVGGQPFTANPTVSRSSTPAFPQAGQVSLYLAHQYHSALPVWSSVQTPTNSLTYLQSVATYSQQTLQASPWMAQQSRQEVQVPPLQGLQFL